MDISPRFLLENLSEEELEALEAAEQAINQYLQEQVDCPKQAPTKSPGLEVLPRSGDDILRGRPMSEPPTLVIPFDVSMTVNLQIALAYKCKEAGWSEAEFRWDEDKKKWSLRLKV